MIYFRIIQIKAYRLNWGNTDIFDIDPFDTIIIYSVLFPCSSINVYNFLSKYINQYM